MNTTRGQNNFFGTFLVKPELNNGAFDFIAAFLIALTPLLQHYRGPIENMGVTALLLSVPIVLFRIFQFRWKWETLWPIIPLLIFEIYKIFSTGISVMSVGRAGLVCLIYVGLATGSINKRYLLVSSLSISVLATIIILVQVLSFYIFGVHLTVVPTGLLLEEASIWVLLAQTGLFSIRGTPNGFYRPSSIFLEPSHFFLYVFPSILLLLFSEKRDWRKLALAAVLSVGMLLSTSGMGLALVVGAWAFYFCFYDCADDKFRFRTPFTSWKAFGTAALKCVLLIAVMYIFPFVRESALRLFIPNESGTTAFSGRASAWVYLKDLTWQNCWFGFLERSFVEAVDVSFTGIFLTIVLHGVIGLFLSLYFYFQSGIVLNRQYRFIALIVIVLSFFTTHTHGAFGMILFVAYLLQGYDEQNVRLYSRKKETATV